MKRLTRSVQEQVAGFCKHSNKLLRCIDGGFLNLSFDKNRPTIIHKRKNYPITDPERSLGFQELEAPRISRQLAKLSALGTGRLYPPGDTTFIRFC